LQIWKIVLYVIRSGLNVNEKILKSKNILAFKISK